VVDSFFLPMRIWRGWSLFAVVLTIASSATSQTKSNPSSAGQNKTSARAAARHPNIILITVDTTRADRMGFLGSDRGLTPNLDAVAKDAAVFSRAYSHVPLTTVSHATILTGTYPQYNHVNDFGAPLDKSLPYLPDILRKHGYTTGAFVGSLILDPVAGIAPGFDRGFDKYDAGFRVVRAHESRYDTVERRAGDVVAHALAWLKQRPKAKPFFLWVHLYDPHDPYDPPEPYKSKFADPYDGEIAYADASLGKLLAELRRAGLYQTSLIAMMADHGEALGEHGERTHGFLLYDETIHVPLLIKLPAPRAGAGKAASVETRVGLVDVMPTVLESAGVPLPQGLQGESLLPLIHHSKDGPAVADRPAYAETDYPERAFKWSSLRALRTGKYLYIEAPKPELYDQSVDPKAEQNLATKSPAVVGTLNTQAENFRKSTMSRPGAGAKIDAEQAAKLSALGYVGGDPSADVSGVIGGVNPKDRIETANQLHDGMMAVEQGQYSDAVDKLQRVIEAEPSSAVAYAQLGTALTEMRDYEKALPVLRKAVDLNPHAGLAQYQLGLALYENGDLEGSAKHFEVSVLRNPQWADAHFSLASVYARIDRVPQAMQELDITLELNSDHYRANLLRGRLLELQGKYREALVNLKKAAQAQPGSRDAHRFLAETYEKLGDLPHAAEERSKIIAPSDVH